MNGGPENFRLGKWERKKRGTFFGGRSSIAPLSSCDGNPLAQFRAACLSSQAFFLLSQVNSRLNSTPPAQLI
jgi:hypothetical protein